MSVTVSIPAPLRRYIGDQTHVEVEASIVREALEQVSAQMENPPARLFDEAGQLRRGLVVALNGEIVFADRRLHVAGIDRDDLGRPLQNGDEVWFGPASTGG